MDLCLVIAERSVEAAVELISAYGDRADSFEIRADFWHPDAYREGIERIRAASPKKLIFTLRREVDGGRWVGSEKLRQELYERAIEAQFDYVDIEIDCLPGLKGSDRTTVIRSFHDMRHVPSDILEKYAIAEADPLEIPKIAVMLGNSGDVIRFLRWNRLVQRKGPRKRIVTAMGTRGVFSRILGNRIGTMHAYVPVPHKIIVPGMIDIDQAVNRYRIRDIDARTRVHGLLDTSSTFIPANAADLSGETASVKNTVRVPFILDTSEEMSCITDFFGVQRYYRSFA